jgi:hypothetical protein
MWTVPSQTSDDSEPTIWFLYHRADRLWYKIMGEKQRDDPDCSGMQLFNTLYMVYTFIQCLIHIASAGMVFQVFDSTCGLAQRNSGFFCIDYALDLKMMCYPDLMLTTLLASVQGLQVHFLYTLHMVHMRLMPHTVLCHALPVDQRLHTMKQPDQIVMLVINDIYTVIYYYTVLNTYCTCCHIIFRYSVHCHIMFR